MKEKFLDVISFVKHFFNGNKSLVMKCIAVLVIIIAIIVVSTCFKGKKYGNSFANSSNLGLSVQEGKWIYYVDFEDDETVGIRKIKENGKKSQKIVDGDFAYLNIIDGNIYCIENDENDEENDQKNLIKMNLNGKKKEVLAKDIDAKAISVTDKWIYYFKNDNLYRAKTNGEKRERISDKDITYYQIEGNWIYYIYSKGSSEYIAKMKLDGEDSERIAKAEASKGYEALYVKGGKIYYIESEPNKKYDYEYYLYSMNKKGEKVKEICKIDENVMYVNMQEDKIYYTVTEDYNEYELKSINYNGTDKTTIKKDENIAYINETEKWLTFLGENGDGDYVVRMISKDGEKEKNI